MIHIRHIDAHYFASEHRPSIRSTRPLTTVAKQVTMRMLLGNAEGRNGQFRNGGNCQRSWLDTHTTHEAQPECIPLHFQASRLSDARALCGASQQASGDAYRTVQKPTTRNNIEVRILSVALRPNSLTAVNRNGYRRRSIESRHVYFMPYGEIWQAWRVGGHDANR